MFTLSVVFGHASIGFMFKTKEAAENADAILNMSVSMGGTATIVDDFGQRGSFKPASIHGVILEDMDQSKLARAEQMVHQALTQAVAQNLAKAKPELRVNNTPAVINPMMNGMRG